MRYALVTLGLFAMAACGSSSSSSDTSSGGCPSQGNVTIDNYAFSPKCITVKSGDSVVFTNNDSAAHTATSTSGQTFDSNNLDHGASFTFTATADANYKCNYHPYMLGQIVVTP